MEVGLELSKVLSNSSSHAVVDKAQIASAEFQTSRYYLRRLGYSFEASELSKTLVDLQEEAAWEADNSRVYNVRYTCPEFGSVDIAEPRTRLEK